MTVRGGARQGGDLSRCRRRRQRRAETTTSLRTRNGTPAEITGPARHVGHQGFALDGYEDVVQRIYAASLDLHAALVILDGHRAAELID